jgi:hypothetical protein
MGTKSIRNLEREFGHSYTESISINTGDSNPHRKDALEMVGNRTLSLSLRRQLRMN